MSARGGKQLTMAMLNEKLVYLLLETPKKTGNYSWSDNACFMEEALTLDECAAVESFFDWLTENKLAYGHGNLHFRWREWLTQSQEKS